MQRCVALLGRVTDTGGFVARGSFFKRDFIRRQRARGLPLHVIAHEDVIIAQLLSGSSPAAVTLLSTGSSPVVDNCYGRDPDR